MRNIINTFIRYGYWKPLHLWTFIHNNFLRKNITREKGAYILTSSYVVLEVHPTAHVHIRRNVRVGVHETKKSRIETSVLVGAHAQLSLGGGGE